MQIFLSWSGPRSHKAAEAFYHWLPDILQSTRPWMSSEDICSGAGWNQEIRTALNQSNFGVIFVTRDNLQSSWLMFEAGAIAKHVDEARVVPLLVDDELKPSMLTGPLGQLHAREATKEKILRLVKDINFQAEHRLNDDRVDRVFEASWPELEKQLSTLPEPQGPKPEVDTNDMLAQILNFVKNASRLQKLQPIEVIKPLTHNRALARLELRLDEIGASLSLRDRVVKYWETLGDTETMVAMEHDQCLYHIYSNGDLRVQDTDVPF